MIAMTLQELRRHLRNLFIEHNIESPEADSGLLLMHKFGLTKTELLLDNREVAPEVLAAVEALAQRRIQGEPVRYLVGVAPFMDLEFYVNPSTLIPRPDTEVLVEAVLARIDTQTPCRLWDIGCGSGCIGITLAHEREHLSVTELDISQEALDTAKRTALRYGLAERIHFVNHNILKGMPPLPPPDMIVSNPPYIPTAEIDHLQKEVRMFEPKAALDGGTDGLIFYRHISKHAPLPTGGLLAFEIGYDQGESVPALMEEQGYTQVTLLKDLSGNPRVVLGYHK